MIFKTEKSIYVNVDKFICAERYNEGNNWICLFEGDKHVYMTMDDFQTFIRLINNKEK